MKLILLLLFAAFSFSYQIQEIRKSQNPHSVRIIGGNPANAGQFPSVAAIYVTRSTGTYFCAGTLIDSQWVLTAGQCVNDAVSFTILLGSNTLQGTDPNRVTLSSSEFILHPDYNSTTLENDVGLIKLRMPVTFTEYVQKVYMAFGNLNEIQDLVVVGWGQTSDSESGLADSLQYVKQAAVSNDECKQVYGNQISDHMVCAAGDYNEGICNGDTGGPLFHNDYGSRHIHVGIATFISGNGCESTDPSGYTRTFSFKNWIQNVTGI